MMKKILYYLLPIIIHFLFLPLWIWWDDNVFVSNVSLLETIIAAIITPIYLLIIYLKNDYRKKKNIFIPIRFFMILISTLGGLLAYFNWGISTGNMFYPDSETLHITSLTIFISNAILIFGLIVMSMVDIARGNSDE